MKGNTAISGGKRLSSKELKASNAHHFLKDGDRLDINNSFGISFFYNAKPRYTEHLRLKMYIMIIYTFSFPCAEHTQVVALNNLAYPAGRRRSRTPVWRLSLKGESLIINKGNR